MAVVEATIVHKRMAALLNAGPDDGTFAITSTDQGKFSPEEVIASMCGGDSTVVLLIQQSLRSGYRPNYCAVSAFLTYTGGSAPTIPPHPGEPGIPEIQLADGSWTTGELAPSLDELLIWKKHPTLFPSAEGHYFILARKAHFIGAAIRFDLPVEYVPDRATPALKAPLAHENGVVCASMANVAGKRGMGVEFASFYGEQFWRIFAPLIRNDAKVIPDVQAFQRSKAS